VAKRGGIENLSVLVARVYPGRNREDLDAVRAFGAFMRALSPRVLRNARPVKLFKGTLTVHTVNSAWANSLQLESTALLAKLKRVAPDARVRRFVFRSGPLPDAALPMEHAPVVAREVELCALPDELARELARIHNDALREAVARAASTGLAATKPDHRPQEQAVPLPPLRR
jgi:Dna[CI] antecedent, DciA